MSLRAKILEQLRTSSNAAVERVLEQALAYETPDHAGALAAVLLARNQRPGWVAMVKHFDRLGETTQRQILERPRELFAPLADTVDETAGEARANVIRIVQKAADAKLVYLLAEALMDARPEVRQLAADSLLDAMRRWRTQGFSATGHTDQDQDNLRRAVDFALTHYKTHRQPAALLAALVSERRVDAPLWNVFNDQFAEATRNATALLRQPTDAQLATPLYLALASPLKSAALHGLSVADKPELVQELAGQSFRLVDPMLAESCSAIGHMHALASPRGVIPWNDETWPAWLRLIVASGMPATEKLAWLARMLDAPGATAVRKMIVLEHVARLRMLESLQILAAYASDPDRRVARFAARALLATDHPELRTYASAVATSPHAEVRRLATSSRGGTRFEKLWTTYPKLPPAVQVNTTRTLASNETHFSEELRAKLTSVQPTDVLQGLRVLGTLADLRPYRENVIALCAHNDARVSSLAVKLVGKLGDASLLDLLEAAARHVDPRVRANAIEAMEQLRIADRSQQVLAMLNSRYNRERANAIKALSQFNFTTARETLSKMLLDPNPMHRVSALWVVEQLALMDLARQVATMARRDSNQHVRTRAAELLARSTGPLAPVPGGRP